MTNGRPKSKIESALKEKGFQSRPGDHRYFVYYRANGEKTMIKTKTSQGRTPKDITGDLFNAMARQCKLSNAEFEDLIDCPLSREQYEKLMLERERL